jgi:hypothetical protein
MIAERIIYRTRQFWNALSASPGEQELEQAQMWLNPRQMALFRQMSPGEQFHSLQVLRNVQSIDPDKLGDLHPDLAVAALLHDVGKCRYPLRLWERIMIVLAGALFPRAVQNWGRSQPRGWRRAFVVAQAHPEWGAQMAAKAGASPLAVFLIRNHQNRAAAPGVLLENQYLQILQAADHQS